VLVAEAIDLAAIALRGPALLLVHERRGRHPKLLGELRPAAELSAVSSYSVAATVAAPALRDRPRRARRAGRAETDAHRVSELDELRRFDPLFVDLDLAGGDGFGGERARLEEARRPEPFVDADSAGGGGSGAVCLAMLEDSVGELIPDWVR
jgi:hypothetical protein